VLLASALFFGFLHGLGADHLMAIAALSVGGAAESAVVRRSRALSVAFRFACGHALLLAVGATALLALGWSLPLIFERAGEVLGGVLLIALGAGGLWAVRSGRLYGHTHRHGGESAAHWHLHVGRPEHHPLPLAHSHLPTVLGAAFALSSLRALITFAPFGGSAASASILTIATMIVVFGLGILLSMSLFGVALARFMSTTVAAGLAQTAGVIMSLASISLGAFWIASA
jgi:nickel/cobalt transporter (NicO) family protein